MKVRSHILSPSVARAIAAVCATVFVTSAHMGWAGINVWTSHGPGSVGITALAVDPTTPNTLYAGTQDGAVFKSTDSAGSWGNAGLPGPSYVRALAIDPTTPGTLYAGTCGGVFSIEQVAGTRVVGTGTAGSCTDAALNAALAGGGLVTFDCGPALVTIDISTGTGTKTIAADTSIDGGGVITISGGHRVPTIFSVNPGVNLTLKNLTIAQNLGFGECGDGLPCHKSAAVANSFGTLTVINSTFTDDGDFGIANFATLSVTNSTFIGTSGEGIANGGTLTVANSTFTANGGGISNYVAGAPAIITNSTFTGNSGAGISNYGTLTVTNSTFTGNSLGISNDGATNGSTVLLRNTIVSNSVSDDNCTGSITDGGHNLADVATRTRNSIRRDCGTTAGRRKRWRCARQSACPPAAPRPAPRSTRATRPPVPRRQ